MFTSFPRSLIGLSLVLGCVETPNPDPSPAAPHTPWSALSPRTPDDFRLMRTTHFPDAIAATQLALDPRLGPALVLDKAAGVVWATDKLFLHDPRIACLHPSDPAKIAHLSPGSGCPDGTIPTRRGRIDVGAEPVAMAIDTEGGTAAILDPSGQLFWLRTDPLGGPSIDHMRPIAGPVLTGPIDFTNAMLATSAEQIALAAEGVVSIFTLHGIRTARFDAGSPIASILLDASGWWALTEDALFHNGEPAGPGGHKIVFWQNTPWVVSADEVRGLDDTVFVGNTVGAVAAWGDRLLVATATGLTAISTDGSTTQVWEGDVVDLATNAAGEVVILGPSAAISIFVDERTPVDAAPLHVWLNAFLERPRTDKEVRACSMDDPLSLNAMHTLAEQQKALLDDLPSPTALGITPDHMAEVMRCGARDRLAGIINNTDLGILFHKTPTECSADEACHQDALSDSLHTFPSDASFAPSWVSGLAPHTELGVDWVVALANIGAPNRLNFFGASILPEVPHTDDLRAKESWPLGVGDHTAVWASDTVNTVADRSHGEQLWVLPGNNVSAFNLGACPNLFVAECHPLGRGDGFVLSEADIESLDLLLHRAMASSVGEGLHTWSFHIPDIGIYDFTEDCTISNGIWSGEDCEGARLQAWLFDAHQRFALHGRIVWSSPATLPL